MSEPWTLLPKLPPKPHTPQVVEQLAALGVEATAIEGILSALALRSLPELESLLGSGAEALSDLRRLFELAEGYGYQDWLVFDASVVRGLAYYTGGWFDCGLTMV